MAKQTLTQYLRSIGIRGMYIDKRSDHYRIKPMRLFTAADSKAIVKKVNKLKLPGVTVKIETVSSPLHRRNFDKPIIRTVNRPSKIII